ncbi:hypothetical protein CEXT_227121 [Caerostris extrusa]|uniref:Uncharacterized protein n=1 Tax=Caerostris extrusa TaxID=172846 RepID=A0AAV4NC58_CAEEX|nr:hypothetical protein CEXT_227121 [Caerostris extrusa]
MTESDWAVDENHSINNKSGGRGGGVGPPTIRLGAVYFRDFIFSREFPSAVSIVTNAIRYLGCRRWDSFLETAQSKR